MINYTKYFKSDSVPWITFIHGAGGSSTIWFKQIKTFAKDYNVLLIDLRGHGNSKMTVIQEIRESYTFPNVAEDVVEVLDHEGIEKSHFAGISLGTIIIRQIAEDHPDRVASMIMGGAIMKMNTRSRILMWLGDVFKNVLPYLVIYRLFAFIMMPKNTHKQSRNLFIREAKKLYQNEFLKWYKMTADINPLLKLFRNVELPIPTLYIMGEEDHMFLPSVQQLMQKHVNHSRLVVFENCGHVVNVDEPERFNTEVFQFLGQVR